MSSLVPSYYSATANPAPTRPALAGEMSVDACVIGGGLTGLSAALHLAERGYKTLLLEAAQVGWGASGRNGGQLNTGLRKGASELIQLFGRDRAKAALRHGGGGQGAGARAHRAPWHRLRPEAGLALCRLQEERSRLDGGGGRAAARGLRPCGGRAPEQGRGRGTPGQPTLFRRHRRCQRRPSASPQFRARSGRGGRGRRRANLRAEPRRSSWRRARSPPRRGG